MADDIIDVVPEGEALAAPLFGPGQARLNITWARQNGELPDPILYESADGDVKAMAAEAIRNGDIPGIAADPTVDFTDFMVDRFRATDEVPRDRVFLRAKTAFGR